MTLSSFTSVGCKNFPTEFFEQPHLWQKNASAIPEFRYPPTPWGLVCGSRIYLQHPSTVGLDPLLCRVSSTHNLKQPKNDKRQGRPNQDRPNQGRSSQKNKFRGKYFGEEPQTFFPGPPVAEPGSAEPEKQFSREIFQGEAPKLFSESMDSISLVKFRFGRI